MHRRANTCAIAALRTSRFTRYFMVPLTFVALLSACGGYKQTTVGPGTLWKPTDRVRVTYETDAAAGVVVMDSARVVDDSLIGAALKPRQRFEDDYVPPQRLAIALADITLIEKRRGNVALLALIGIPVAAFVIWGVTEFLTGTLEDAFQAGG